MDKTSTVRSRIYRHLPLMFIAALVFGSVAASASAQSDYYGPSLRGPISARVLLLVPDSFDNVTYRSRVGGVETVHYFGRDATEELRRMLTPAFQRLTVWHVGSEADAMDMLAPDNPRNAEVQGFDYVAIPHFNDVNSRPGWRYRFEIDMVLDLYAIDGSKITSVRGYGESNTGDWYSTTPLDAGHVALRMSAEAIRDGIEGRRSLFAVVPGSRFAEAPPAPRQPFDTDGSTNEMDVAPAVVNPIPVRVLLLVPDDFSRFVYTTRTRNRDADHFLGEHAEERFRTMLTPQFQHLTIRPVASEAEARDMLSPDNPANSELKGYDYVAIPRFSKVNSWSERSNQGVEIDLNVDFFSTDGAKEIKFKAYGNNITGLYGPREVAEARAGNLALNSAMKALRESIDRRRNDFTS